MYDADAGKVLVMINQALYPSDALDVDAPWSLVLEVYDPAAARWSGPEPLELKFPNGIAMSFSRPIKTSKNRLVFPGQGRYLDDEGKPVHYKGCWKPAGIIVNVLGEYRENGTIEWKLSRPVIPDLERTSRGFYDPAIAELGGGRFVMVLRGDNSMFPDRPGYKWLSFSTDHCHTWSDPVPLGCDDGQVIESSSSGSALFRSIETGKLYWIGNLCIDGVRPSGNFPRTPLVIREVQEDPFALKRDTITVIDRRTAAEPPQLQLSNFRFYQDRENGDVVLFLTRYAERGANAWMLADYYRYRIRID